MERMRNKIFVKSAAWLTAIAMVMCMIPANLWEASAAVSLNNPVVKDRGDGELLSTWDCIYFGHYPQSSDGKGGFVKEPIKWRVLSVNGNEAFLLADKNLDARAYNEAEVKTTWERSTIRSWLNGYDNNYNDCNINYSSDNFMDIAFTSSEQAAIKTTKMEIGDDNPQYAVDGGNITNDKIVLLTITDATTFAYGFNADFTKNDDGRKGQNTAYTASVNNTAEGYAGWWWLCSPGVSAIYTSIIHNYGYVEPFGDRVTHSIVAVRPALRLDLTSNLWSYAGTVCSNGVETEPTNINDCTISNISAQTYTGNALTPAITIKDGSKTLVKNTDYTVSYKNSSGNAVTSPKDVGTYSVILTGTGNYTGTITKTFTINKPSVATPKTVSVRLAKGDYDAICASWSKVSVTGAAVKYKVQYKVGTEKWKTATSGATKTSHTIKNLADGKKCYVKVTPYVTVNEKTYSASGKNSAAIYTLKKLNKPSVKKASSTKVKVSWNNISGESGYEIYKSTKKTKGFKLAKRVTSATAKSATFKVTKKKTYYYKVRAFKTIKISGKSYRVYGPWSSVKSYKLR